MRNKRGELFTAFLTSFDSFLHDAVWNMDMMIMYISMFTLSARRAPWAQQARPCILMCSVLGCLDSWWEEREGSDLRDHLEASVNKTRSTWLPSLESYGMSCREAIKREEWKQKHCVVISCLCWIDLNISFTLSIIFTFGGYSSLAPGYTQQSWKQNKSQFELISWRVQCIMIATHCRVTGSGWAPRGPCVLECRTSWPQGIAAHKYLKCCVNWLKTKSLRRKTGWSELSLGNREHLLMWEEEARKKLM